MVRFKKETCPDRVPKNDFLSPFNPRSRILSPCEKPNEIFKPKPYTVKSKLCCEAKITQNKRHTKEKICVALQEEYIQNYMPSSSMN